jgi:hypothetical protein
VETPSSAGAVTGSRESVAELPVDAALAQADSRTATQAPRCQVLADHLDAADSEIDGDWKRVCVIELAIEHMTGKASIELLKERG